ncbi:MAG: YdcH family protein [Rhodobacteraceae bacterium]|nr:YdcH family protein [Paracoccaceae bacterium]
MSLSAHVEELRRKHETLSDQVDKAQRTPGADPYRIAEMKKQKLRLKEEIHRLATN